MAPFRSLSLVSSWLLRLSVIAIVFFSYKEQLLQFDYKNTPLYYAIAILLLSVVLLLGGFVRNEVITMLSSIILLGICIYKIYINYDATFNSQILLYSIIATISIHFMGRGNK